MDSCATLPASLCAARAGIERRARAGRTALYHRRRCARRICGILHLLVETAALVGARSLCSDRSYLTSTWREHARVLWPLERCLSMSAVGEARRRRLPDVASCSLSRSSALSPLRKSARKAALPFISLACCLRACRSAACILHIDVGRTGGTPQSACDAGPGLTPAPLAPLRACRRARRAGACWRTGRACCASACCGSLNDAWRNISVAFAAERVSRDGGGLAYCAPAAGVCGAALTRTLAR